MKRVWDALVPWLVVLGFVLVVGFMTGWIESIGT